VISIFGLEFDSLYTNTTTLLLLNKLYIQSMGYTTMNLYNLNLEAFKFFQSKLNERSLSYLSSRGLDRRCIDEWGLGYAPDGWQNLHSHLTNLGYSDQEIEAAGLIKKRESGGYYDRFRDRLMIPIRDADGQIVGFAGRAFGDVKPKYLNSPETKIFEKRWLLFGLDRAKQAILEQDQAIVVEGYFDVIALHEAGIRNAVANMGTALKASQIKQLTPLTKNLILGLDNDSAGKKATERAIATIGSDLYEEQLNVRVLSLPDGVKDSDEFLQSHSSEQYRESMESARAAKIEKPAPKRVYRRAQGFAPTSFSSDRDRVFAEVKERINQDLVGIIESKGIILQKRGRELVGLCPFHDEKTPSFSVNPEKGLYYCFGCGATGNGVKFLMEYDKMSFKEVILANAKYYGYDIEDEPQPQRSRQRCGALSPKPQPKPQPQYFDDPEQEKVEEAQANEDLLQSILSKFVRKGKKYRNNRFKGDALRLESWDYECYPDELEATIAKAAQTDKKVGLVSGPTGSGKTHKIAKMTPKPLGCEQLFYITDHARNPTIEAFQDDWDYLPSRYRHGEIVADSDRQTPSGGPWAVRRKGRDDDRPIHSNYQGNCAHTPLFTAFGKKGYEMQFQENPICGSCQYRKVCAFGGMTNYSFKSDRRDAYTSDRVIAHLRSLSPARTSEDGTKTYDRALALVDDHEIQSFKALSVSKGDVDKTIGRLHQVDPDALGELSPWLANLQNLLDSEPQNKRYGDGHDIVVSQLTGLPDDALDLLTSYQESIEDEIGELLEQDYIDTRGNKEHKALIKAANQELQNDQVKAIEKLEDNWLIPLIKILQNGKGALRLHHGKLTVKTLDPYIEILKEFKKVVFFSATETPEKLAAKLGVTADDIAVIKLKSDRPKPYERLTIQKITDMPKLGKDSRDTAIDRAVAIASTYTGKIAVLTHQKLMERIEARMKSVNPDSDLKIGAFYVDSKGQNQWQDRNHLIIIGCPTPNIGDLQDEYRILFGVFPDQNSDEFKRWLAQYQQAEIVQAIGRLRANRRDEDLMVTFISDSDYLPDDFIRSQFVGAKVGNQESWQINPEAGDTFTRNLNRLIEAVAINGDHLSQNQLAVKSKMSKGQISKIFQKLKGGYSTLLKCFQTLYSSYKALGNTLVDEDMREFVIALLGDLKNRLTDDEYNLEMISSLLDGFGESAFLAAIADLPDWAASELSALFFRLYPALQSRFEFIWLE